jgi:hypothetical protein
MHWDVGEYIANLQALNARKILRNTLGKIGDVRPSTSTVTKYRENCKERNYDPAFIHNNFNAERWMKSNLGMFICNVKNRKQLDNLAKRVIVNILRIVTDNSITHILMMDGHGRTLYLTLKFLYICRELIEPDRFNQLINNIYVAEITDSVHEFHEYCFPTEINCVKNDVFNVIATLPLDNTLIYLNFCGLGIAGDKKSVKRSVDAITTLIDQDPSHLMISYGLRGSKRTDKSGTVKRSSKAGLTDTLDEKYGDRPELTRLGYGGMKTWYSWPNPNVDQYANNINQMKGVLPQLKTSHSEYVNTL